MNSAETPEEYLRSEISLGLQKIRDNLNKLPEEARKLATASAENIGDDDLVSVASLIKTAVEQSNWLALSVMIINISSNKKEDE